MSLGLRVVRHLTHGGDDCCSDDNAASALIAMRTQQNQHGHSHGGVPFMHGKNTVNKLGKFIRGTGTTMDLLKHFFQVVSESSRGKLLLSIWGGFLVSLYMFKSKKKKRKKGQPTTAGPAKKDHTKLTLRQVGRFIFQTIRPHLTSLFGGKLVLYLALLTFRIRVTVKLAALTGRMGAYFGSRRWDSMFDGQVTFGLWCMVAAGTTAAMKYMEKIVALDFRSILYRTLHNQYFQQRQHGGTAVTTAATAIATTTTHQGSVMYAVGSAMHDAPSRVTQDLKLFSNLVAHEFGHIVKPLIDMIYLTTDLTAQIGAVPLVGFLTFFYWSKTALTKIRRDVLPLSLSDLARKEHEQEARLIANAQHVHDFREEISMQRGQSSESQRMLDVYERLNHTSRLKNIYECFMDTIRSYILKYGGAMTAFSMLIPAAYVHESNVSQEDGTANYMLRSTLLMSLANAVKDLADSVNCLNELVGVGGRVMHLSSVLKHCSTAETAETASVAKVSRHPRQDAIEMVELNVAVPTSATATTAATATAPLIEQLTTTIQSGQHTVVVGPNGTGKTSLFRTLGGVWSPASGSAVVPSGMYIMPQRPNFTWRAALWEQVAYPWEREPRATSAKGRQEIEQWLTVVGLGQVVEERGLDANDDDFHTSLSGGQQQRVMWARMLYNVVSRGEDSGSPPPSRFVLLDEATSAISSDWVGRLYALAKENGITLVSIAHSKAVEQYHDHVIALKPGGQWERRVNDRQ